MSSSWSLCAVGLACALTPTVLFTSEQANPRQQDRTKGEIWFNPGVGVGAPTDPGRFVKSTDVAIVGVLKGISVGFIDPDQHWLFTTLTFTIGEWLYPSTPQPKVGDIEILTGGGTYIEDAGRRIPKRPADIAQRLEIGAEYFVPVNFEERPNTAWSGKYTLRAIGALIRLDQGEPVPVYPHSKWLAEILLHAPTTSRLPGPSPTRRDLLLETIRKAAERQR